MKSKAPTISAMHMKVGDIMLGEDGHEYIITKKYGIKRWCLYKTYNYPPVHPDFLNVGDVLYGADKNTYVVSKVDRTKVWSLYHICNVDDTDDKCLSDLNNTVLNLGDIVSTDKSNKKYIVTEVYGNKKLSIYKTNVLKQK